MTMYRFMTSGRSGCGRPGIRRHIRGVRSGFTLVETLAVIAIIAVVVGMAVPAVTSLNRNSQRRAAVSLILSTLDQARGLALSKNSTCYLVVANAKPDWPENLRSRSFAIFEEVYNATSTRYDLLPITSWTALPEGFSFKPGTDTILCDAFTPKKFYCHPAGVEIEASYFKFNSLGTLDEPTDPNLSRLRIFSGTVTKDGDIRPSNPNGAAAEEVIRVTIGTGRARREEYSPGSVTPTAS